MHKHPPGGCRPLVPPEPHRAGSAVIRARNGPARPRITDYAEATGDRYQQVCLLGQKVRYDAPPKRDRWIVEQTRQVRRLPAHLPRDGDRPGTPRPPIRLVAFDGDDSLALIAIVEDPSIDVTDGSRIRPRTSAAQLGAISGYVFMSKSPSCGMERVKLRT